jgi:hypothetical protein
MSEATSEIASELPKPAYNFHAISKTADKIRQALQECTEKLEGNAFTSFVGRVKSQLSPHVTLETVKNSLTVYLGRTLTDQDRTSIAVRLAGNHELLSMQKPVLSWCCPRDYEWVLAEMSQISVVKASKGLVNRVHFYVLSGSAAGYELVSNWSFGRFNREAVLTDAAGNGFGLTYARINRYGEDTGVYTYQDYRQLIGFHCYLLLDPKRSQDFPEFCEIGHSGGTMHRNRRLFKDRQRKNEPCLVDVKIQHDCYVCPLGKDKCPRAIRELSCVIGTCKICGKRALRDPSVKKYRELCLSCRDKQMRCGN